MWTAPGTMPSSHSSRSRTSTKIASPTRSRASAAPTSSISLFTRASSSLYVAISFINGSAASPIPGKIG